MNREIAIENLKKEVLVGKFDRERAAGFGVGVIRVYRYFYLLPTFNFSK